MTDNKRFTLRDPSVDSNIDCEEISDNGNWITYGEIVDKLNELNGKIERYEFIVKESIKTERTDMGRNVLIQLAESLNIEVD